MNRLTSRLPRDLGAALGVAVVLGLVAAPAGGQDEPAPPRSPAFLLGPLIRGRADVGAELRIRAVTIANPPATVAYDWRRCDAAGANCVTVADACSSRYALTPEDLGHRLLARMQLSNSVGTALASTAFSDVVEPPNPRRRPPDPAPEAEASACIVETPPPAPAPPPQPAPEVAPPPAPAPPAYLLPFPTVRIRGVAGRGGLRVTMLSVQAPPTARIRATCRGRGCPRRARMRTLAAPARVRALERFLRAGTVIAIRVTAPGAIGKYTSFRIRRRGAPRRADRCLLPGRWAPTRCPTP